MSRTRNQKRRDSARILAVLFVVSLVAFVAALIKM